MDTHELDDSLRCGGCLLLQLRSAWAIAQVLNRTLVLPEFWSGQDRCAVLHMEHP
jgi:hypothetical protein